MSATHDLESLLKKLQSCIHTIWNKAYKLKSHQTNIKEIKKMYESINHVKKIIDTHLD